MRKQLLDQPAIVNTDPLHVKYRPQKLADVLGQDAVVKSLKASLEAKARPHAFIFTGPSGTGKTTLARIVANRFDVDPNNITEVDAATNTGVDAMRDLQTPLRYQGFGATPNKAIIIDEAHMLSKGAWNSLLKTLEEPPPHVYFFICTTESGKIPETVVTRCSSYHLRAVRYEDIMDLLDQVCEDEGYKTPERLRSLVARSCDGSPRKALTMLAKVHDCDDEEEAARLLETQLEQKEIIDLCRELVSGKLTWDKLVATLKGLEDTPAESIRIVTVNYLNSCLLGAKTDKSAVRLLDMLECFMTPCQPSDKLAPILIAFGRWIFP